VASAPNEPAFQFGALLGRQHLYVYGPPVLSLTPSGDMLLARVPVTQWQSRSAFRFWNGSTYGVSMAAARPVMTGPWFGVSVTTHAWLSSPLVAIYATVALDNTIRMRQALRSEGPWGAEQVIAQCQPGPDGSLPWASGCYLPMDHPELSTNADRTWLVTYHRETRVLHGEVRAVQITVQ
jgi:hypothetical protein